MNSGPAILAMVSIALLNPRPTSAEGVWQQRASLPVARAYAAAVWTGTELIVWGGHNQNAGGLGLQFLNDGARYNPIANTWTPINTEGAPSPRSGSRAVWTGSEMIVWGGLYHRDIGGGFNEEFPRDGGRYDPLVDAWRPMTTNDAPAGRSGHTHVWTGSEMIVWGGQDSALERWFNDGARYNPITDTWTAVATNSGLSRRSSHTAVWTGSEMIVWGGGTHDITMPNGARYNPLSDSWTPLPLAGTPARRTSHSAVWTGDEMIVWGGIDYTLTFRLYRDGGRYRPASDTWSAVPTNGAPGFDLHRSVWTGTEMIVWGDGISPAGNEGARYRPVSNRWTALPMEHEPAARLGFDVVWTGSEMMVVGGFAGTYLSDVHSFLFPPSVRIEAHSSEIAVSWPFPSAGFSLEKSSTLMEANWTCVTNAIAVGNEWRVTVPASNSSSFRLRRP